MPMVEYYGKFRPDTVVVFGHRFKVTWFADQDGFGEVCFESSEIKIGQSVAPEAAGDVLIHEILHVIWYLTHCGKKEREEAAISKMATGLNAVFSQNPKLGSWFSEIHERG